MSLTKGSFEPAFSDAERDEFGHLHYLAARLDELRTRGLITPDAHATVVAETQCRREAIELSGSYRKAITQAKKFAKKNPREALHWADCAQGTRSLFREEAWDLIVGFHCDLGDADRAITCCGEAAQRASRGFSQSWTGWTRRQSSRSKKKNGRPNAPAKMRRSRDGWIRPGWR